MPIYEYECGACGKQHEVMQKITESPLTKCPDCGGKMKKMISNTTFVLKGTGWYATDYASGKKGGGNGGGKQKPQEKKESSPESAAKPDTTVTKGASAAK